MPAGFPVQLHQQVGGAVAHRRLLVKLRVAVDHYQQLDHPLHLVQVADDAFGGGKAVDGALPRGGVALIHAQLPPQLAGGGHTAVGQAGQVAGYEQQPAGAHRRDEVANGRVGLGYHQPHLGQFALYFHYQCLLCGCRRQDAAPGDEGRIYPVSGR